MKWIALVVAALLATPALADGKDSFSKADLDNDGFLSKEEFYRVVSHTGQKYFYVYEENDRLTRADFERIRRQIRQDGYRDGA